MKENLKNCRTCANHYLYKGVGDCRHLNITQCHAICDDFKTSILKWYYDNRDNPRPDGCPGWEAKKKDKIMSSVKEFFSDIKGSQEFTDSILGLKTRMEELNDNIQGFMADFKQTAMVGFLADKGFDVQNLSMDELQDLAEKNEALFFKELEGAIELFIRTAELNLVSESMLAIVAASFLSSKLDEVIEKIQKEVDSSKEVSEC